METYTLRLELKSDAAFGRGDGVPGLVDQEVEHDEDGLPFLRARTLKGLLVEEADNIIYALGKKRPDLAAKYQQAARTMFGRTGSGLDNMAVLQISDASLPSQLRVVLQSQIQAGYLTNVQALESLTDIRRQTAVDATGKPEAHSLRSIRVILRGTILLASLTFTQKVDVPERGLLAACIKAFRRAGTGRNRGTGHLAATLWNEEGHDVTDKFFKVFKEEVTIQ